MTPRVGEVIKDWTTNLITRDGDYKYHLCVCEKTLQFLLICHRQMADDFLITDSDCGGLPLPESYVSISRVLFVDRWSRKAERTCRVSDAYLAALLVHVRGSPRMTPKDKRKVIPSLEAHLAAL